MKKILITDKQYPEKLKRIKNSPKQLYYEGNINLLNTNIISIIGSRNCTQNGVKLAKKFASELAVQNITIASGLAKGIDAVAHKETLEVGGKTIAVLGNGLNNIFPMENKPLYEEILKKGGLIITEYEPDTEAKSKYFLERNRIVSGIALGVLVVEAAYRSGTSVTAKLAVEQNRKVFVLPHDINDIHGVGTNNLIKKGAILVTSSKEIIDNFEFLHYNKLKQKELSKVEEMQDLSKLDKEEQEIYKILMKKQSSINELCMKTKKSINKMSQMLFNLEIEGYIEKVAGGYKCILKKKWEK